MRARLALAAVLFATNAAGQDWNELDVRAELGDDGRLRVTETHELLLDGPVEKIGRDIGLGAGQTFAFESLARLDAGGAAHPLDSGDLASAERYQNWGGWIQWSVRAPDAPPFRNELRRYVLRYEIVNALAPAWDLPNGPDPLDPFHPSYLSPLARARQVWSLFGAAWPRPDRYYRLDHDVLFPNHDAPSFQVKRLDYHLEWNLSHWRLVDPQGDIGRATPNVDYRVQRTLEYLAAGRPASVDFRAPAVRIGSILGLWSVGLLLWLLAGLVARVRRLGEPTADPAFFEASVLCEPPELAGARLTGQGRAPIFEFFLLRLAAERKLAIEVTPAPDGDSDTKTHLRLQVDKAKLHPYEREALDALWGDGREITSDEVQRRHAGGAFDPQQLLEAAFERVKPRPPGTGRGAALLLSWLMFAPGVVLAVMDLMNPGHDVQPYALGAGLVGGFVGILPLPLLMLTLAGIALAVVPNVPLSAAGSAGVALMLLARYPTRLGWGFSRKTVTARQSADLVLARDWAAAELKKSRPALRDAWIPHLEAIGLGDAVEKWKRRNAGTQTLGAPDLADVDPSQVFAGPPFTGTAPAFPAPSEEDWADAFFV